MSDIMTSHNIDLSSWDSLYMYNYVCMYIYACKYIWMDVRFDNPWMARQMLLKFGIY
jgi:hypothetical protein